MLTQITQTKTRCAWAGMDPLYVAYHDDEWGVPVHDDRALFEFLILEGAQAGLSWSTILNKRVTQSKAGGGVFGMAAAVRGAPSGSWVG